MQAEGADEPGRAGQGRGQGRPDGFDDEHRCGCQGLSNLVPCGLIVN